MTELHAIFRPDGKLEFICSSNTTERDAWITWLGWPTKGEVRTKQAEGYRCGLVQIADYDDSA